MPGVLSFLCQKTERDCQQSKKYATKTTIVLNHFPPPNKDRIGFNSLKPACQTFILFETVPMSQTANFISVRNIVIVRYAQAQKIWHLLVNVNQKLNPLTIPN